MTAGNQAVAMASFSSVVDMRSDVHRDETWGSRGARVLLIFLVSTRTGHRTSVVALTDRDDVVNPGRVVEQHRSTRPLDQSLKDCPGEMMSLGTGRVSAVRRLASQSRTPGRTAVENKLAPC